MEAQAAALSSVGVTASLLGSRSMEKCMMQETHEERQQEVKISWQSVQDGLAIEDYYEQHEVVSPEEDDYDPRSSRYILPSFCEEVERDSAALRERQAKRLESVLLKRRGDHPEVLEHYQKVVDELRRPQGQGRSRSRARYFVEGELSTAIEERLPVAPSGQIDKVFASRHSLQHFVFPSRTTEKELSFAKVLDPFEFGSGDISTCFFPSSSSEDTSSLGHPRGPSDAETTVPMSPCESCATPLSRLSPRGFMSCASPLSRLPTLSPMSVAPWAARDTAKAAAGLALLRTAMEWAN